MTKKTALELAIATIALRNENDEAVEVLQKMIDQLEKPHTPISEEKKAAINAKRKEATATARAELLAAVTPVVRSIAVTPMTVKEIFAAGEGQWPADFTAPKLQNVLIREMAPELDKVEAKGKPNTYCVKG